MVDELGDTWRYWGDFGGSDGTRMAVLRTIYWEYWETHGGIRDNMVGVLGDAWRYWGAVWWEYRETRGGTPSNPWNNSEGVLGHSLAPPTNERDSACGRVHSLTI